MWTLHPSVTTLAISPLLVSFPEVWVSTEIHVGVYLRSHVLSFPILDLQSRSHNQYVV